MWNLNLKNEYYTNNIQGLPLRKLTCSDFRREADDRDDLPEHFQAVHERKKYNTCEYEWFGS